MDFVGNAGGTHQYICVLEGLPKAARHSLDIAGCLTNPAERSGFGGDGPLRCEKTDDIDERGNLVNATVNSELMACSVELTVAIAWDGSKISRDALEDSP